MYRRRRLPLCVATKVPRDSIDSLGALFSLSVPAGGSPQLNLKGFFVGNAWTVAELDNIGALEFWYSRTMIDKATHDGVLRFPP